MNERVKECSLEMSGEIGERCDYFSLQCYQGGGVDYKTV